VTQKLTIVNATCTRSYTVQGRLGSIKRVNLVSGVQEDLCLCNQKKKQKQKNQKKTRSFNAEGVGGGGWEIHKFIFSTLFIPQENYYDLQFPHAQVFYTEYLRSMSIFVVIK
jgi:hypothetical protein